MNGDAQAFLRDNPKMVAAMAMKREKRPKKKAQPKKDEAMSAAAARRLAKLKGGKNGTDSN